MTSPTYCQQGPFINTVLTGLLEMKPQQQQQSLTDNVNKFNNFLYFINFSLRILSSGGM